MPQFGFEFRKYEMRDTLYTGRLNCMDIRTYESVFFSAVKVGDFNPTAAEKPKATANST